MSLHRSLLMAQQKIENPYDFNGIDKYLDTGIKLWTGDPFTLMIVFKSRAVDNGVNQTIFTTRNYGNTYGVVVSQFTGSNFDLCGIVGDLHYSPSALFGSSVRGVKRGIMLRYDGTGNQFSLKYSKIVTHSDISSSTSSSMFSYPSSATDETLLLGANRIASGIGEFWDGRIYAIAFENRELTSSEQRNFFINQGL